MYHYPEVVEVNDKPASQVLKQDTYHNQKTEGSDSSSDEDADPATHSAPMKKENTHRFRQQYEQEKKAHARHHELAMKGDQIKASEDKVQSFMCNMFAITFGIIDNGAPQGYSVRLELIDNEDEEAEK